MIRGGINTTNHDSLPLRALLGIPIGIVITLRRVLTLPLLEAESSELAPRADAGLGEHVAQVERDGARADPELRRDVLVGHVSRR